MIGLIIACLAYQDPFSISLLPTTMGTEETISAICFTLSLNFLVGYWSLMIDSIRQIKVKSKSMINSTLKFEFYRTKVVFISIGLLFSLTYTIVADRLISANPQDYDAVFFQHLYIGTEECWVLLICGISWLICTIFFICWMGVSISRCNHELSKLSYYDTRERQLLLRFFKHHTIVVASFLIIYELWQAIFLTGSLIALIDMRGRHIGSLLLVSAYVYTLGYAYMPYNVKNTKIFEIEFELGLANILCHMSDQAYLNPSPQQIRQLKKSGSVGMMTYKKTNGDSTTIATPKGTNDNDNDTDNDNDETTPDGDGDGVDGGGGVEKINWDRVINVKQYGLKLIDFIHEDKEDVQCIICEGEIWEKYTEKGYLNSETTININTLNIITNSNSNSNLNSDVLQSDEKYDGNFDHDNNINYKRLKQENVQLESIKNGQGSTSIKKYRDLTLAFRGTASAVNAKLDLKWSRETVEAQFWYGNGLPSDITKTIIWNKCVRPRKLTSTGFISTEKNENELNLHSVNIHGGFIDAFNQLRIPVIVRVLKFCDKCLKNSEIPRFFITGHSLGGAIAQLFGLAIHVLFGHKSPVFVYSYGSPRVGDPSFAKLLESQVTRLFRIVNEGDPITTVPKSYPRFKHGGHEMIINKQGTLIVDPSSREKSLLPDRNNPLDHLLTNYKTSLNALCEKENAQHFIIQSKLAKPDQNDHDE